jgi:hypothetical protein
VSAAAASAPHVPFRFAIDLPIVNDWANIDLVRTSVLNCFTAIFQESPGCTSFANVASELMENAIKYGDWKDGDRLHLRVWGDRGEASVQVENPIGPGQSVGELLETLRWLGSFASPAEAYRARMLAFASAPRGGGGSTKLGLARVAYEGRCRLSAEVAGDVVRVTGVAPIDQ